MPSLYMRRSPADLDLNKTFSSLGPPHGAQSSFLPSVVLALVAITAVTFCISRRTIGMSLFGGLPLARVLLILVFLDSWLFIVSSTILQASFGLNSGPRACDAGILLCLVMYLSSKLIYFFLVEKVFIVRGSRDRWKDKLFLFNTCGMLLPYCVVIVLTFVFRNAEIGPDGQCRIGLRLEANIPLLTFDLTINVYLTYLFLKPLGGIMKFATASNQSQDRFRRIARRTFIGSCATLASTLANLISLLILRGKEPGWICFCVCNADILFSVLVLHWVTHQDHIEVPTAALSRCTQCKRGANGSLRYYGNENITFTGAAPHSKVVTSIKADRGEGEIREEVQMDGILRRTEVTRQIEPLPDDWEMESQRNASTEQMRSPVSIKFPESCLRSSV